MFLGANVKITGSYIMDNCVIEDTCIVETSILGNNVTLLQKVQICSGCIIEGNVTVGPYITLESRTKVSAKTISDEFSTDEDTDGGSPSHIYDTDRLGLQALGYIYDPEVSDDDNLDVRNCAREYLDYESSLDDSECDLETDVSEDENASGFNTEDENDWIHEVEQTLQRAFEDNHTTDIASLELNTLKMAMNITFKDLRQVVLPAIFARIPQTHSIEEFNQIITKWCPIMLKFTHSDEDQIDCLNIITQHLLKASYLLPRMPLVLKHLYEMDILEEYSVLNWFSDLEAVGSLKKVRDAAIPFVSWLKEAESESESESESD